MPLFVEIYLLLFLIFKSNWQQYCFFYESLTQLHYFRVIKEFRFFLFYLSILVDSTTWHAGVGMFSVLNHLVKSKSTTRKEVPFWFHLVYVSLLFLVSTFQQNNFQNVFNCILNTNFMRLILISFFACQIDSFLVSFCHWNPNGLSVLVSIKISLLQVYITQHNFDIICLSEISLNSSIKYDEYNPQQMDIT